MPVSGAMDPISFRIANELVGNPLDTAALEIRMLGPVMRVEAGSVRVALAGTNSSIEVIGEMARTAPAWQSLRLEKGDIFRIGPLRDTTTCYLAIEGGFDLPRAFGSLSTYLRGQIGGLDGRALQAGDKLPLELSSTTERAELRLSYIPRPETSEIIRVVLGPQTTHFTPEAIRIFLTQDFAISHQADRHGVSP